MEAEPRLRASAAAPLGAGSIRIRLLSASDSRPSTTSSPRSPAGFATGSAVSAVHPPANTPSRANRRRSGSASSSSLQAIARRAASAAARAGPAAPPPRSRLCSSRSRICDGLKHAGARRGELERQRQAAEPLGDRADGVHAPRRRGRDQDGARARDRRTARRRRPASSGGTGWPRSPLIRSSSRLVTRSRSVRGVAGRGGRPICGAVGEQLLEVVEDEQAVVRSRRWIRSASSTGSLGRLADPDRGRDRRARSAPGPGSRPGRRTRCRAGSDPRTSRATASASRVLPLPPGPVRVTIRLAARSSRQTAARSSSRPTRLVTSPGRFVGASVVRSGRSSSAAPGTTSR